MSETLDLHFEIDYPHEHAGWIDCFLTFAGERHKILASDVFPPFPQILGLLRALHAQRLPHEFFWDEEGKGAKFEALPLAPDSPEFRLRVIHDREETPWIDAELDRQAVIHAFTEPLRDFAQHMRSTRFPWGISKAEMTKFDQFLKRHIPPRTDIHFAEPIQFTIHRSKHFELPTQWMEFWVWEHPLVQWVLKDTDPFWRDWISLLEKVIKNELPASFVWSNLNANDIANDIGESFVRLGILSEEEPVIHWMRTVHAEPLGHPDHFRLIILETGWEKNNYPLLDEALDRCQVIQAFCETFEQFLEKDYQVFAEEDGHVFDLRTLPLNKLRELTKAG